MLIKISNEISDSLESGESATELIEILNKIDEDNFIIDFKDVYFMTGAFAQAYWDAKLHSPKHITEINLSDEIRMEMESVEEQFMP